MNEYSKYNTTNPEYDKAMKEWETDPYFTFYNPTLSDVIKNNEVELRQWCLDQALRIGLINSKESILESATAFYDWITQTGEYAATKSVEDTAVSGEK